jgi:hypothetical protein
MLAGSAPSGAAGMDQHGAAWPKGHYAALDKLPDWGGVWVLNFARPPGAAAPEQPQLKGQYLTDYQAYVKEARAHNGMVKSDASHCMPPGMPRMMATAQYPIEFLFTPGRVTTLHEAWAQSRTIFTDGRGHDPDKDPGIYGDSIGHWDGDTLVVDTVGIKTVTELARGAKHSDKLHVMERIHLAKGDPDTLIDEMTMTDPEALAAPYHQTYTFKRQRDWNLMEFICAENDRNPVGKDGYTEFE